PFCTVGIPQLTPKDGKLRFLFILTKNFDERLSKNIKNFLSYHPSNQKVAQSNCDCATFL
ncbi:MAG: hypothetical protein LUD17_03050, partial [Bacteroidales bacterium]|nr:hypothetical protein [Bacteroidales bacterium]